MFRAHKHGTIQTVHTSYAGAVRTTTHLQTGRRKPYAATLTSSAPDDGRMRPKHVELRKLQLTILLHQVDISLYFMAIIFIFTKKVSTQLPFIDVNIAFFYLSRNYEFFEFVK